jgi:hypothetical protein
VSIQNSAVLHANLPATITCPANHGAGGPGKNPLVNGACRNFSYPELYNDVFYDNRSFYIGVGTLGSGTQNQQNVVALYNAFTTTQAISQTATGQCPAASYWDIGVRGDSGPTTHESGITLNPEASLLTNTSGYNIGGGTGFRGNTTATSASQLVVSQYCNGSRVPPEAGKGNWGWQVPPGISDATVPNPIFNLTPAATVDEGNNWINISWGPLSESNPTGTTLLGNYAPASNTSPVVGYITPSLSSTTYAAAPSLDFFGNLRKTNNAVDIGAIEFQGAATAVPTLSSISPATHTRASSFTVTLTGTALTSATGINVTGNGVTVTNLNVVSDTSVTATFTITGNAAQTARNVTIMTPGGTSNAVTFTIVAPVLTSVTPNSGSRGSTVQVALVGSGFSAATGVTVSGLTVNSFTVVDDTDITASVTIPNNAAVGNGHNVTVQVPGGNTGTLPFRVLSGTVAFSAPAPLLSTGGTSTKNGVITVSNTATGVNAGPVTLTANPTITKVTGTGTFSITSGGTCVSGVAINAGSNCTINVQYLPPTSGSLTSTAHVTITDTGASNGSSQNSANFTGN